MINNKKENSRKPSFWSNLLVLFGFILVKGNQLVRSKEPLPDWENLSDKD